MTLLGKPLPHDSARLHVTGEAMYVGDLPPLRNEVLVDIVGSPVAHGRIKSLDVSAALKRPGVHAVITAKDMPNGPPIVPMRLQPLSKL